MIPVVIGPDLKQRTLSAIVLAPVVLATTVFGGLPFLLLWTLAGAGVLLEWCGVARLSPRAPYLAIGFVVIAACAGLRAVGLPESVPLVLLVGLAVCALLVRPRLWAALGLVCAAACAFPVVVLRGDDQVGLLSVFFLFAVVWGTDIGAYFTGRIVGGPKLWPRLSPNKTWSGAIGGAVFGTLAGTGVALAGGLLFSPVLFLIGLLLSVISQSGDLAESAFKRAFGVKDAGWLIPGHGGILDRLDGFAAAALAALVIAVLHGGPTPAAGLLLW